MTSPPSQADMQALAEQLHQAAMERRTIPPCAEGWGTGLKDAYAIQRLWLEQRLAEPRHVIGHKVGFTAVPMQQSFGLSGPVFGVLLDDMMFSNGTDLPGRFIAPRIEIELAMVMGRSIAGANRSLADILDAVDHVVPAFEIIDNRMGPPPTAAGIVADNAGCAGIVLGGAPTRPDMTDLANIVATLFVNGVASASGESAAVLGHPARSLTALLDHLATYEDGLVEGQVVLTGAFCAPMPIAVGDSIDADFGSLGTISTRLS